MGEFVEPYGVVEHDGDVISGADYNSLEHNLAPEDEIDNVAEHAAATAKSFVAVDVQSEQTGEPEISAAERAYDNAADLVEKRREQGLDAAAAWHEADPTGKIRKTYEEEERQKQDALNHERAALIRQETHDAKVAIINKILDPKDREHAMNELLAEERAREEKKKHW